MHSHRRTGHRRPANRAATPAVDHLSAIDSSSPTRPSGMPRARPAAASSRPANASSARLAMNISAGSTVFSFPSSGGDASPRLIRLGAVNRSPYRRPPWFRAPLIRSRRPAASRRPSCLPLPTIRERGSATISSSGGAKLVLCRARRLSMSLASGVHELGIPSGRSSNSSSLIACIAPSIGSTLCESRSGGKAIGSSRARCALR